ncbi:hypothetical protein [Psychrobacter glacincola]|uniref:Uncharacterized protein n=1 Tax=Psychrobacter glacincola TaxID=56810 RepID=A0ABW1W4X0_9GAMM|nr:hypothetical protein [Psychrobacter glacincola]
MEFIYAAIVNPLEIKHSATEISFAPPLSAQAQQARKIHTRSAL